MKVRSAHSFRSLLGPLVAVAALSAPAHLGAQWTFPLNVTARDYSLEANDAAPSGLVQLRLINRGTVQHQLTVVRIPEGVSYPEAQRAVEANRFDDIGLAGLSGPVAAPDTTKAPSVTMDLRPGRYLIVCATPLAGSPGRNHVSKGMTLRLNVVRTSKWGAVSPPLINERIRLHDDRVTMPAPLRTGAHMFEIENVGGRDKAVAIERFAAADDSVWKKMKTRPASTGGWIAIGGTTRLSPRRTIWASFLFDAPGKYRFTVSDPSAAKGRTVVHQIDVVKAAQGAAR